ncbi:MAG TPA: nucleotide exchange factor GrpE [Ignavibacteriaceae bacterium]|nr:nucleotide exchange factor GrpE [Ignavibacteriaceae bacterium]
MKNKDKHDQKKHDDEEFENKKTEEHSEDENTADSSKAGEPGTEQLKDKELYRLKIEQLQKDVDAYKDAFLRKAADFENYKRRTENDQLNLIKYSGESLLIKLLPIVDDLERSLQHLENNTDLESMRNGIKLIYDNLMKILNQQGVKKIEAVGKPFDVHYHEAMLMRKIPPGGTEPHMVLEELQPGYQYKDKVIRHSKVIVSEEGDQASTGPEDLTENNK